MDTPPFLGLRTCGIHVPDLAAAKAWYTTILGQGPYFDEPFYVGFNVGGYELGLQPKENDLPSAGSVLVYWGVDDIEAAYARLLGLGATSSFGPADVGDDIQVAAVLDPWGNPFGIIRNPHFKASASSSRT